MMKKITLLTCLMFLYPNVVVAGPFEDGVAAYNRKDYETAFHLYRSLAEQGNAKAQNNFGVMYAKDQGVPQDYAKAIHWYKKTAIQGDAHSQFNLGLMYDYGRGVPQDYAKAVSWYRKAAEQGHAIAQNNLGVSYAMAKGVPKDDVLAHMWINLAAASGDTNAKKARDFIAKNMTRAQIAKSPKRKP